MARSAATRLARAARAAAAATARRQAPGASREVLPRALAPLASDASAFATAATRRPVWLAAPLGRFFPVGAGGAGLMAPPRRLFHSTAPAHHSAAGTSSSSQVGALCTSAPRVSLFSCADGIGQLSCDLLVAGCDGSISIIAVDARPS
jgi:hypothetical protein